MDDDEEEALVMIGGSFYPPAKDWPGHEGGIIRTGHQMQMGRIRSAESASLNQQGCDGLSATDERDEFKHIAIVQRGGFMLASGDDLTVEFHRHRSFSKPEGFDELADGLADLGLMFFAIDDQFHN